MQTSQVSNLANAPVNALSSLAQAGKQSDANSPAEPFGQVLSREMSGRHSVNEPSRPKDSNNAYGKQPAANSKPAKPDEGAPQEDIDTAIETVDAALQVPDGMVANLTQLAGPAPDLADAASALQETPLIENTAAAIAPVGNRQAMDLIASQLAAASQLTGASPVEGSARLQDAGAQRRPASALASLMDRADSAKQLPESMAMGKTELPDAISMQDLIAKGKELLNGASVVSNSTPDLAAAVKESLTSVTNAIQPAQHAALQAAQPLTAQATEKLTPPVGSPGWDQALGQKVVWMVAGEHQSASLTLNPPDLGPLQVVLNVSNSQANATFIAAQPEVRQALEAALPKLRDMLSEAGIQLGQATVNSGSANQHNGSDQHAPAHRLGQAADDRGEAPGADASARVSRVQQTLSGQGLVDTFA